MKNWGRHEYGKTLDAWPKAENGEPVPAAFLAHCSPLDMDAQALQSMLEAFGIPSFRLLPGDGQFGEIILGMSGNGINIMVPETMLADAQALLEGEPDDDGLQA